MKRWLLLLVSLTTGCGSLTPPPLPKFATGEAPRPAASEPGWSAKLRAVDLIYLRLTNESPLPHQPAWRIVAALQADRQPAALGWTEIPAAHQPLLDGWQRGEIPEAQLLDKLVAASRREWLRQGLKVNLPQVALGAPPQLLGKIRAGTALTPVERALLPRGFETGPNALDDFAERVASVPRLRRYNVTRLFRAHVIAEKMIADNIVRYTGAHSGTKLLVILPDEVLINARELADYVGQKANLKQIILNRETGEPTARPPLLARH